MGRVMDGIHSVSDRHIVVDEVGLRLAIFGDARLRTVHQPMFAVRDGLLSLTGVRAYLQPSRDGASIPPADFLASIEADEQRSFDRLVTRLHVENRLNAGVDDPELLDCWVGVGSGAGIDGALEQIDACAAAADGYVGRIVCEIMQCEALTAADVDRLASRAHARGMRVCVDALGAPGEALGDIDADFVKMRGSTFRNLARVRKAADLIGLLVEGWRRRGVQVLVEGIETRGQLAIAVDAGANLVQGFLLGPPKLAGAIIDDQPHSAVDILYGDNWPVVAAP